jgi:hypothetical protein
MFEIIDNLSTFCMGAGLLLIFLGLFLIMVGVAVGVDMMKYGSFLLFASIAISFSSVRSCAAEDATLVEYSLKGGEQALF